MQERQAARAKSLDGDDRIPLLRKFFSATLGPDAKASPSGCNDLGDAGAEGRRSRAKEESPRRSRPGRDRSRSPGRPTKESTRDPDGKSSPVVHAKPPARHSIADAVKARKARELKRFQEEPQRKDGSRRGYMSVGLDQYSTLVLNTYSASF